MSNTAELEGKLKQFLSSLVERLPEGKTVSTPVVQQLLRGKHADTYSEEFISSHTDFIATQLLQLLQKKKKEQESKDKGSDDSDESDDSDDEEEDDEEDESDEEDEDEEESGSDEDDESPELKKAKLEVDQKLSSNGDVPKRCKEMVNCLTKLHYRVRSINDGEEPEAYLQYLIEEFKAKNLDPERYSKSDIKKYQLQKEIEALRADSGISTDLDRSHRMGRGIGRVKPSKESETKEAPKAVKDDWFLDD